MKQRIKVRIGEEMSEGREIGIEVRQGCPPSPTLFRIYLEDLMKNCFPNTGGVNIAGRRIKCIGFAHDMALLAEENFMSWQHCRRCNWFDSNNLRKMYRKK